MSCKLYVSAGLHIVPNVIGGRFVIFCIGSGRSSGELSDPELPLMELSAGLGVVLAGCVPVSDANQ